MPTRLLKVAARSPARNGFGPLRQQQEARGTIRCANACSSIGSGANTCTGIGASSRFGRPCHTHEAVLGGRAIATRPEGARGTAEVPPRLPGVVWAPDPASWSPLPSPPTAAGGTVEVHTWPLHGTARSPARAGFGPRTAAGGGTRDRRGAYLAAQNGGPVPKLQWTRQWVVSSILAPPSLREVQGRPRPPTVASARRPPRTGTRPPRTPGGPTWLALGWHGSGGCQWL